MYTLLWAILATVTVYYFGSIIWSLRCNINSAKQSGLKYTITPVHLSHKGWLATQKLLIPILHKLPDSWTSSWLPLLIFDQVWHAGHAPFARLGTDTFLAVSPSRIVLWTCDAEAVQQICERRKDFPKPVGDMGMLNIHGPTVTGTEGEESRRYRRITTGSFGRETYVETWKEGVVEAGELFERLKSLTDKRQLNRELETLTLNVVSTVCFGGDQDQYPVKDNKNSISKTGAHYKNRHTMTYRNAFGISADNMGFIYLVPHFLLRSSPFSSHQEAWRSFLEWRWYMEEMVATQRQNRLMGNGNPKNNLLNVLVEASEDTDRGQISESAILGNIWVFILGGYHTSANTLHFIFILLAINPEIQHTLQQSLDDLFGDRHPSTWSYDVDFPALLDGHVGAVIAETVRLFGVLPFIPKSTGEVPQSLTLSGQEYIVPADTMILINTSAVHRNPRYWPIAEPKPEEEPPFPVSNWDPWRWLEGDGEGGLFRPQPGTYITFSEGARQCIGKRFAQVELCAVVARVLKEGSIELVIRNEGEGAWAKARERAVKELSTGVGFKMALELFGKVELSFLPRK